MGDEDLKAAGARGADEAVREEVVKEEAGTDACDARKEAREDVGQPQGFAKKYTLHHEGLVEFDLGLEGAVVEIPDSSSFFGLSASGKIKFTVARGSAVIYKGWLNHGYQVEYVVEMWNSSEPVMIFIENKDGRPLEATVCAWG